MRIIQDSLFIYDLETTGDDPDKDQVCQVAVLCCDKEFRPVKKIQSYIKPSIPIKPEATRVHGITDSDVVDAPSFGEFWRDNALDTLLSGALITSFNGERFDDIIMANEIVRHGIDYDFTVPEKLDVYKMYQKMNPATLVALVKRFLHRDITNDAHDAWTDTRYTANLLSHFMRIYEDDLPENTGAIAEFLQRDKREDYIDRNGRFRYVFNKPTFKFGKYNGRSLEEVARTNPGYLDWLVKNFDDDEVRKIALNALRGTFPEPAHLAGEETNGE